MDALAEQLGIQGSQIGSSTFNRTPGKTLGNYDPASFQKSVDTLTPDQARTAIAKALNVVGGPQMSRDSFSQPLVPTPELVPPPKDGSSDSVDSGDPGSEIQQIDSGDPGSTSALENALSEKSGSTSVQTGRRIIVGGWRINVPNNVDESVPEGIAAKIPDIAKQALRFAMAGQGPHLDPEGNYTPIQRMNRQQFFQLMQRDPNASQDYLNAVQKDNERRKIVQDNYHANFQDLLAEAKKKEDEADTEKRIAPLKTQLSTANIKLAEAQQAKTDFVNASTQAGDLEANLAGWTRKDPKTGLLTMAPPKTATPEDAVQVQETINKFNKLTKSITGISRDDLIYNEKTAEKNRDSIIGQARSLGATVDPYTGVIIGKGTPEAPKAKKAGPVPIVFSPDKQKVKVVNAQGIVGWIPYANMRAATSQGGYKLVQ